MGAQCGPSQFAAPPSDDVFARATHFGVFGWRPMSALHASEQIGMYGDVVLTSRWTFNPGVQRVGTSPPTGWDVVHGTDVPDWEATVTPGNVPGGQRFGSTAKPSVLTPWTAAQATGALARAQAAQSGMGSAAFIRALIAANQAAD